MLETLETGQRSLSLKCRECGQENIFSFGYLWETGARALNCSHCDHSAEGCYWEKDRKRAYMFAVRIFVADQEREKKEASRQRNLQRQLNRPIGKKLRFEILKRDEHRCRYCGRSAPDVQLHVDHVIPRAKGGFTSHENLVAACSDCNLGKGAR